jgi:glyoxylase-like metal-dependent hydrolase (beta-lactamase superfamily II)
MELEPGIHQLTFGREPIPGIPPPNAYLLVGSNASLLIDSGFDEEADHQERMAYLQQAGGPPVEELLLTHRHPDHAGGAALLANATGMSITCHAQERKSIEGDRLAGRAEVFSTFGGGESQNLGGLTVQIIHTPGHTLGSVSLYIPERNALFTADTVIGVTSSIVRPSEGDLGLYVESLQTLQALNARVIYSGHGGPVTDPANRIRMLLEHRLRREEALLEVLAKGPGTVTGLRQVVYTDLPAGREKLAEEQVQSGLNKLVNEGRVAQQGDAYALT